MSYRYKIYGLVMESDLEFPELPEARPEDVTTLTVERGSTPEKLENPKAEGESYQASANVLLVRAGEAGRFLVLEGRKIIYDPAPQATEEDLRVLLLCSPIGAAILQSGSLPLHASSVTGPAGTYLFVGNPGAGKSTISTALCKRGYSLVTDDVAVVSVKEGKGFVYPGYAQSKLWPDSVTALELKSDLPRLQPGLEKRTFRHEKFYSEGRPLQIDAVFVLEPGNLDSIEIKPFAGPEKLKIALEQTYRFLFVNGLGIRGAHFQLCSRFCQTVPFFRLARPTRRLEKISLEDTIAHFETFARKFREAE